MDSAPQDLSRAELGGLEFEAELLGMSLFGQSSESLALTQHTSYSDWGDDDITDIIKDYPGPDTQSTAEEAPGSLSSTNSERSGKRKASEMSTTDVSGSSQDILRPAKSARTEIIDDEESNPFLEKKKEEGPVGDPYAPLTHLSPNRLLQNWFNQKKVPFGVQYEIARYVSLKKLEFRKILVDDVNELADMKTNERAAPAAFKKILKEQLEDDEDREKYQALFAKEEAAKSPWRELDWEETATHDNQYGGLGFTNEGEHLGWHGGQVIFHGKLHDMAPRTCKKSNFELKIEPATLGPSNMFARRFGSKSFFRLRLTKTVLDKNPEDILAYLQRPLVFCGGVYRAYYFKSPSAFYFKTNETTNGEWILQGIHMKDRLSFLDFCNWHNSLSLNKDQKMAKWVSRFALGLSNSVPGLIVDRSNIRFIDDIISETGSNMTDGAGKINRWALNQIRHRLDFEDKPTAIQMRLFGNADEFGCVELTPSQRKIKFAQDEVVDPAHCVIDVLRASHTKAPCRLSVETIINLAENGVPREAFLQLLRNSLKELVEPLLEWDSPDALRSLWCSIRRLGGVMAARRAREEAGLARVKGYSERDADEEEFDDDDGLAEFDLAEQARRSTAWWGDEVSGCPSSLEETIMYMLDSGLKPQGCYILRDKLHKFVKCRVNEYIKNYRIDVPMSASAFLVADTDGILEEGEVFFKSSRRQFRNHDGTESDIFVGDVVVTRHPCKLPTDSQKWRSVDRPELHHKVDVIILSTKGPRRAADWLSGGDYDGDKGLFIYQPELVQPFRNAQPHFADPPSDIDTYFNSGTEEGVEFPPRNEEVADFMDRTSYLSEDMYIRELQNHLLGGIRIHSVVGKYSNFHEIAIYTLGYTHPTTIRLAYMFCMVLDGVKTGKTVKLEVFKNDTKDFNKRPPKWKESEEEKDRHINLKQSNEVHAKRPPRLGRFIMDDLHQQAESEGSEWHSRLSKHFDALPAGRRDEDLARPWENALIMSERWKEVEKNSRLENDLEIIRKHVEECHLHRSQMQSSPKKPRTPSRNDSNENGLVFSALPIEVRQDMIRELSKEFANFPHPSQVMMSEKDLHRIKASYAYVHDQRNWREGTRFPWDVAMRELCAIKAEAAGRHKTVAGDFYDHFNMKHPKKYHI